MPVRYDFLYLGMAIKDRRYTTVKRLVEIGDITRLDEIFHYIPKSMVAKDLGTNYNRLIRLLKKPEGWILQDLYRLAELFGIDEMKMIELAHAQRKKKPRP